MITKKEWKELGKAFFATSLAFAVIIYYEEKNILFSILTALLCVGTGFIVHELAHRYAAFKFKKHAEFEANNQMLLLTLIMSFLGVIFAAPGAVKIMGFVSRKESGVIAAVGPFSNIVLAVLFIPFLWIFPSVAYYGIMINALLGIFNLIPIPGFDGEKVLAWDKTAYFSLVAFAIIVNLINMILPNFVSVI